MVHRDINIQRNHAYPVCSMSPCMEYFLTYTMYVLVEPSPSLVIGQKIGSTNPAASFIKYLYVIIWDAPPFQ